MRWKKKKDKFDTKISDNNKGIKYKLNILKKSKKFSMV